jgi:hypothetical protein
LRFGELVWQRAEQRQDRHEAPVLTHFHVENIDLQHVARVRTLHIDRPGDEMGSGPLHQRVEGREIIGRHQAPVLRQRFFAAGRKGMQRHRVTRGDL